MPVRELTDSAGKQWRVWEVTPESVRPQTLAEDYLADCYRGGWLVFETFDGSDKRRFCPIPFAWAERDDGDLEALLRRAEAVRPLGWRMRYAAVRSDIPPHVPAEVAETMPRDPTGNIDMRYLGVVRTFDDTSGVRWRACVLPADGQDGPPRLRLESDTRSIDLADWPPDWVDFTDDQFVELLRGAELRIDRRTQSARRRRTDEPRVEQ